MTDLRDRLASYAHPAGGWGYRPDQPPHLEPTAFAVLALGDAAAERTAPWWATARKGDGSFRLPQGRLDAVWGTAQTLFALPPSQAAWATVGRDFLLSVQGRVIEADPEIADMSQITDIDQSLIGWPWAEGTFSWIEPTSWAVLALTAAGDGQHPRVREGVRLLLDRVFDAGGVNYGNKRILGKLTEPIPGPTALALIALQREPASDAVTRTVEYLARTAAASDDLEHLAWARLALDLYRPADDPLFAEIEGRLRVELDRRGRRSWVAPSVVRLALPLLALDCTTRNPFRLPATPPEPTAAPKPPGKLAAPLGERIQSKFQTFVARGLDALRQPPARSAVHIARAGSYADDLLPVLQTQFAQFREECPLAGKRVVLKPNLVEYHRDKVINTHPRVVDAVIALCQAEGAAEVVVAEGTGHWRNVEYLVEASGLGEVLERRNVKFVDLNHDEPHKAVNLGQCTGLSHLFLAKTIATADVVVSLPKLKTHHWAGVTLSLKNLFGTLPGICYGWPKNELHWRGIPNSIIDIALTHTPQLAVVDGIVGMQGDGPLNGTAKPCGALVMGTDLLAVDATCARLMGFEPERIPHLWLGHKKRLGRLAATEIQQLGEPVEALATPFEPPPRIETVLLPKVSDG